MLSFSFVVRASRAGAEAGLEREDAQEQPRGKRGVLPGQNIFNVTSTTKTLCPSGLRGWTQIPLARAAWAQIPQVSSSLPARHPTACSGRDQRNCSKDATEWNRALLVRSAHIWASRAQKPPACFSKTSPCSDFVSLLPVWFTASASSIGLRAMRQTDSGEKPDKLRTRESNEEK